MMINSHSVERIMERKIPFSFIRLTIDEPDRVVKETQRKVLYRRSFEGRTLDVVMRKEMLVTTYWSEVR